MEIISKCITLWIYFSALSITHESLHQCKLSTPQIWLNLLSRITQWCNNWKGTTNAGDPLKHVYCMMFLLRSLGKVVYLVTSYYQWPQTSPTRCLGWDLELNWVGFWGFSFLLWCCSLRLCSYFNSLSTKKQRIKFLFANFQKMLSPSYILLRNQILEGKQCRSGWGGSLWATSSRSTLSANSAIFVSGA